MASFLKAISSAFLSRASQQQQQQPQHQTTRNSSSNRDRERQQRLSNCSASHPNTTSTLHALPQQQCVTPNAATVAAAASGEQKHLSLDVCCVSPDEPEASARTSGVLSAATTSPPESRSPRVARPRLLLTDHNSELPSLTEPRLASPSLLSPEERYSFLLTPDDQSSRPERGFNAGRERTRTATSWAAACVPAERLRDTPTSSNLNNSSAAVSISPSSPSITSLHQLVGRTRGHSKEQQLAAGHLRVPHSPSARSIERSPTLAQPSVFTFCPQNPPATSSLECTHQPPQPQQKPNRTAKPNVLKLILRGGGKSQSGERTSRSSGHLSHESPLNSPLSSDGSSVSPYVPSQPHARKSFVFTPRDSSAGTPTDEHPESGSLHVRHYKPFTAAGISGAAFARPLESRRPSVPVGCLTSVSPLITASQANIVSTASRARLLSGGALTGRRLSGANARRGSLLQQQQQQQQHQQAAALGLRYQLLAGSRSRSSGLGLAAPSAAAAGNFEPTTPTSRCSCSSFLALSHRSSMTHGSQLDLCTVLCCTVIYCCTVLVLERMYCHIVHRFPIG